MTKQKDAAAIQAKAVAFILNLVVKQNKSY
jgi:hypothetical protein